MVKMRWYTSFMSDRPAVDTPHEMPSDRTKEFVSMQLADVDSQSMLDGLEHDKRTIYVVIREGKPPVSVMRDHDGTLNTLHRQDVLEGVQSTGMSVIHVDAHEDLPNINLPNLDLVELKPVPRTLEDTKKKLAGYSTYLANCIADGFISQLHWLGAHRNATKYITADIQDRYVDILTT
jgi:hypothetical protein